MAAWMAFFWACVPTEPVSTHLLPCWVAFTSQMAVRLSGAMRCLRSVSTSTGVTARAATLVNATINAKMNDFSLISLSELLN